ncbi:MAG: O-antigen ligase family protein [Gammaproteobacteria bacterium]
MAISFVDAAHISRTAQTVWPYLRYFFVGIYVLYEMRQRERFLQRVETGFFIIMTFWSLDGILQFVTGRDIFGYPFIGRHFISGPFYPAATISHVLAGFAALYFESLRRRSAGRLWVWLLVIPLFVIVFECGRRSVWLMLILNTLGYTTYHLVMSHSRRLLLRRLLAGGLVLVVILGIVLASTKSLQKRVDKTKGLFSTNIEKIDKATSHRVDLWEVAWKIYTRNWIDGIGPRGFRDVYQKYASKDNQFYKTGETHPHMVILEILAESGTIGLAGYVFFLYLLVWNTKRYFHDKTCFACFLSLFTASFPINSHVAFYGAYWSSILWWMIIFMIMNVTVVNVSKTNRPEI